MCLGYRRCRECAPSHGPGNRAAAPLRSHARPDVLARGGSPAGPAAPQTRTRRRCSWPEQGNVTVSRPTRAATGVAFDRSPACGSSEAGMQG